MQIFENLVDRAFLSVGKFEAEAQGKLLHLSGRHRIFMNTHVLLVPFDKLERGNEDEIFLRGDALRGGVLRRHIGRIVYVEIAFFEGRQAVFFYNLRRNDAVYLRLLRASFTASRTIFCDREPLSEYTGTIPFKR